MVVVQIKNLPAKWNSLDEKYEFLIDFYEMLLNLSYELNEDRIEFVGEIPTLH